MALEHGSEDQRLLTTEEAQELINLYARREQARRAEAERLAAMPKLSDVAGLIGVAPEDLMPLLVRLRGAPQVTAAGEPDIEVRLSQFEADRVIELYGQTERERQAELERRAQMTSIHEVAEGLQIPVEDAEELLDEVRHQRFTFLANDVESQTFQEELVGGIRRRRDLSQIRWVEPESEPAKTDSWAEELERKDAEYRSQERARTARRILIFLVAVLLIIVFLNIIAARGTTTSVGNPYPSNPQVVRDWSGPTGAAMAPTSAVYRSASLQQGAPTAGFAVNGCPPMPQGWSLKLYVAGGVTEAHSNAPQVMNEQEARQRMLDCARRFTQTSPGAIAGNQDAPATAVPYSPASTPKLSSELAGWAVLEIGDGRTVRRVYIPTTQPRDRVQAEAQNAELERRLAFAVGLPEGAKNLKETPHFTAVQGSAYTPPPGVAVTVFAYGQAYRSAGKPLSGPIADAQQCSAAIEEATRNLVRYAYEKNKQSEIVTTPNGQEFALAKDSSGKSTLVPFQTSVNVWFTYGSGSFWVQGYREALLSGDSAALAQSLSSAKSWGDTAAQRLVAGR